MLGDGRLALHCFDNQARTGLIRGTMRRRVWINTGDIVLVGLREFQPDKADVIHKYTTDEARSLQAYGELPANAKINQTTVDMAMDDGEEEEDLGFDFEQVLTVSHAFFFFLFRADLFSFYRYKVSSLFHCLFQSMSIFILPTYLCKLFKYSFVHLCFPLDAETSSILSTRSTPPSIEL